MVRRSQSSAPPPPPPTRRVMLKPRVRTVQARVRCFHGNALREAGDMFDVVGDEEVSLDVFMLLGDEPAVFGEVVQ